MEDKQIDPKVVNQTTIVKHPFEVDWEQATWMAGVLGGCIVIAVMIFSVASFNTNRNEKMAEAIKNGSHPMDVYCTFDGGGDNKVCIVRAAVAGKEIK